jgi:uncharacterized protein (TIRG00374 family)
MKKLLPRVLLGVAAGVAIYLAFVIWKGWNEVRDALSSFHWWAAAGALGLAAANYLVRFLRWQYYLRVLKVAVPAGESFLVFLGGFALTVTPGKLGEAVKAFLLKESRQVPAAVTAPIVIAERLTDLIGLLLLAMVGVFTFDVDRRFLAVGAVVIGVGLLAISVESVAKLAIRVASQVPGVRRFAHRFDTLYASTKTMLRPGPLLWAVVLSVISWAFECVAFWLVVAGFPGAAVPMQAAIFIYAAMTVAGALSFLPGGLGVTELGMLTLLTKLGSGITHGVATGAVFVTRLCTLWFAVGVGLLALVLFARRTHVSLQLPEREDAPASSV